MTHFSVKSKIMEADITTQAVGLASNTDFSLMSLFIRADVIVKTVILILIAASIYSWAIIFDKIKLARTDETTAFIDYGNKLASLLIADQSRLKESTTA